MKTLITENQNLKQEIQKLKDLSSNNHVELKHKNPIAISSHLHEADLAMDRYYKKLRKENVKYAKQKQSKGK